MRKETTIPISRRRKRRTPDSCLPYLALAVLLICGAFIAWGRLAVLLSGVQFLTQQEICQTVLLEGILVKEEIVIRSGLKSLLSATDGKPSRMGRRQQKWWL